LKSNILTGQFTFEKKIADFICDAKPDYFLDINCGEFPEFSQQEIIFDTDVLWRLGRSGNKWVISCQNPYSRQMGVFSEDFESGNIFVAYSNEIIGSFVFPLAFPMGELYLMNILGSGNGMMFHASGVIYKGEGYLFLPEGISIAAFLAAFAYSGAGGNLNLTQSIYIKEKGYGMGIYSQKISSLFSNKKDNEVILEGTDCAVTPEDTKRFKKWWRLISIEHAFVFWFLGSISMIFLMLLSYATTYGLAGNAEGISFVINEGSAIGKMIVPFIGTLFLIVVSVMLFQTQLGVMDSTSRIMAENFAIRKLHGKEKRKINLSKIYYSFVWAQIAFGIILFLLNTFCVIL